jgi:hypothetical protein
MSTAVPSSESLVSIALNPLLKGISGEYRWVLASLSSGDVMSGGSITYSSFSPSDLLFQDTALTHSSYWLGEEAYQLNKILSIIEALTGSDTADPVNSG